jgi:hypothetical protein
MGYRVRLSSPETSKIDNNVVVSIIFAEDIYSLTRGPSPDIKVAMHARCFSIKGSYLRGLRLFQRRFTRCQ